MNKSIFILSLIVTLCGNTFAQNNGFLGKKNFVAIDANVYTPVIFGIRSGNEYFKTTGSKFAPTKNYVDYGVNFTIGRALTRDFAFLLQYSLNRYEFNIDRQYFYNTGDINNYFNDGNYYELLKGNWLKAVATTFMPILEFSGSEGLLPLGLSHQFGLGFTKNKLIEDDYNMLINNYYETFIQKDDLFNYSKSVIKSYTVMYKINMRIPINDFLLFNVGFRYNLNIFPSNYSSNTNGDYLFSQSFLRDQMRAKQFRNILSLETGLSFCF